MFTIATCNNPHFSCLSHVFMYVPIFEKGFSANYWSSSFKATLFIRDLMTFVIVILITNTKITITDKL